MAEEEEEGGEEGRGGEEEWGNGWGKKRAGYTSISRGEVDARRGTAMQPVTRPSYCPSDCPPPTSRATEYQ